MIKILLLSNDKNLKDFCLELQNAQLSIVCASSYDALIEKNEVFSLTLLDFNLVENGCAQIIEAICSNNSVSPILFLVHEASIPLATKMLKYGVENIIVLPCCPEYLMGYINYYTQPLSVVCDDNSAFSSFIGISTETSMLKKQIELAARTNMNVSILGETGTGKSYVARLIHQLSDRHKKNFIEENTAAIQDTLIEGEFFGTKQGAYTGAITRIGLFEHAHEGTLFLDEIACLSSGMQAKLLQVLDTGEFRPVGDVRKRSSDVRVISATNSPLAQLKEDNVFRKDLYYRLTGIQLHISPLRKRKVDIVPLGQYFLNKLNEKNEQKKTLTAGALFKLEQHTWPGNIRELSTCIERSYHLSSKLVITDSDITFVP